MDDISEDPRFAHIASDPRFKPMPKSKKKVKIDSRFQSLFTNRHFSHRTDMDKRGKPVRNPAKKNKHTMEKFYDLSESDEDSNKSDSAETDDDDDEEEYESEESEIQKNDDTPCIDSVKTKAKKAKDIKSKIKKPNIKNKHAINNDSNASSEESEVEEIRKKGNNAVDMVNRSKSRTITSKKKQKLGVLQAEKVNSITSNRRDEGKKKRKLEGEDLSLSDGLQQNKRKKLKTKIQNQKQDASENMKTDTDEYSLGGNDLDQKSDAEEDSDGEDRLSEKEDGTEEEDSEVNDDDNEDDDSDDSEDDEEELPEYTEEFDLEETGVDHKWNELQNDAPEVSESTSRLAVCNMDWDFVKAQDLFVLFKSFVPEGGCVKSVAIYPSEFGKERMAEEALLGPKEMREQLANGEGDGKNKKKKGKKMNEKKEKDLKKGRDEVQHEKLREYQLNRLKYYYAVVTCDAVRTADTIYTECDGREYQLSSVRLDLRFIPEDMTFDDAPRETFSEGQTTVDYQPSSFESSALCQAKVEVTWDETEFDRLSRRVSVLQQKDLESIVEDNKYADIIAPPESDSEDEGDRPEWLKSVLAQNDESDDEDDVEGGTGKAISEEDKIKLYRKLLMDKVAEEEEEKQKEEEDVDKVLEWQPGLKTSVEKKLKKKEKKKEESALVNDYLEKKRAKKRKKREEKMVKQAPADGEDAFSDDDLPTGADIDDSLKKMMEGEADLGNQQKKEKKKKKKPVSVEENELDDKERAELELMLMDDDTKHLAKPEIVDDSETNSKKKRKSKKKMAKLKKAAEQQKEAEDFVLDVEDKRFGALFTSHHFHIDPSAPQFKKTKNMLKLVDEQIKRKKKSGKKDKSGSTGNDNVASEKSPSSKSLSQSLVESLKKKMKKT